MNTITVPAYTGWVVEFKPVDLGGPAQYEIRRYKTRAGRPAKPSEYIPKKCLMAFALEILREDLGNLTTNALMKEHA
jgi:hypothetical protein